MDSVEGISTDPLDGSQIASQNAENAPEDCPEGLKGISPDIILRAKLICSHFLLPDGARILDLGCENGALTAAMAHFCPRFTLIGVDRNPQVVERAQRQYINRPNLSFIHASADKLPFSAGEIDGVINSRILGDIYSLSDYSEAAVRQALTEQFRVLRPEGLMVIYDYAKAPDDEFTLLEFPTLRKFPASGAYKKTRGDRDAENLIWFSENARPKQARGCEGFFLEELPPRFPYTRLFRLPAKWAYEFIIRKENMDKISRNIGREHAIFSDMDYYRELQALGGRVLYSAPWQNPYTVRTHYKDSFRMYHDDGKPLGYPPTGFLIAVQKLQDKKSLLLHELRASKNTAETLLIQTVRDERDGQLIDTVERYTRYTDVIPFTRDEEGRLKVYLHYAAPKCLINTVPRLGGNLDGKRWSGHMLSALKMPLDKLEEAQKGSAGQIPRLIIKETGLRPVAQIGGDAGLIKGPEGYPAPDMVNELIRTCFIEVSYGQTPKCVSRLFEDRKGFSSAGEIREFDVEDVLRAINVGFVPNAWLEIQLHDLLKKNGEAPAKWLHEALPVGNEMPPPDRILRADDILAQMEHKDSERLDREAAAKKDKRFRKVKGSAGKIRTVRSVFIDEGVIDGRLSGLASSDADFAIPEGETINKAVVLALTANLKGQTLAGFEFDEMPVPYRFGQEEPVINLPSFTLPREITTMDEAKAYIAEKFETTPDRVSQMGESFFTCIDVTPQRIFPFAVASAKGGKKLRMFYAPIHDLWKITDQDYKWSFLFKWGLAHMLLCQDSVFSTDYTPRLDVHNKRFGALSPRHSSAAAAPSSSAAPIAPASASPAAPVGAGLKDGTSALGWVKADAKNDGSRQAPAAKIHAPKGTDMLGAQALSPKATKPSGGANDASDAPVSPAIETSPKVSTPKVSTNVSAKKAMAEKSPGYHKS